MKKLAFGIIIGVMGILMISQLRNTQNQELLDVNLLARSSPGFENGLATWEPSTAAHLTRETSNPGFGTASGDWDPAADNDTLSSNSVTIPDGLHNRPCHGRIHYNWNGTSSNYTFRVTDGTNTLVETDLVPYGSWARQDLAFTCPSSGSIRLQLEANADASAIELDNAFLGMDTRSVNVSQTELVTHAKFAATTNCEWSSSSSSLAAFGADAQCPALTVEVGGIATPTASAGGTPEVGFSDLPEGKYVVTAIFTADGSSGSGENISFSLNDGTNNRGHTQMRLDAATIDYNVTVKGVFEHSGGAATFEIFGATSTGNVQIKNDADQRQLYFTVIRLPSANQTVVPVENRGWYIDINLGGGNYDLDIINESSYKDMDNSSISLTNNNSNVSVGVACNNPTSNVQEVGDTTCEAAEGDESNGITWITPWAGTFLACVQQTHQIQIDTSEQVTSAFQIVQTPTNALTISQEGKGRQNSGYGFPNATNSIARNPMTVCGILEFDTAGERVVTRVYFEQDVNGTPDASIITADENTGFGQRDVHWLIYPLTRHVDAKVVLSFPSSVDLDTDANACGTSKLCAGTYDPTVTCNSNCDSSSALTDWQFMRVGNVVTVSGALSLDPDTGGPQNVEADATLPFSSDLTSSGDLGGVADVTSGSTNFACAIRGDTSGDEARFDCVGNNHTDERTYAFTFQYIIK